MTRQFLDHLNNSKLSTKDSAPWSQLWGDELKAEGTVNKVQK